ncbi:MAG: hypothetical protein NWF07_00875 [Candidatus Bathyarchaeota archaeon]|nr:hypothetical protein [Candidatus Bathyarchaeota archaeon]
MENSNENVDRFDDEIDVKQYLIPKNIVNGLIDNFSIIRNKLSEVLDIPPATTNEHASGWWQQQSGDDQIVLRAALTAMAAPAMISQISIMKGNDQMIQTTMAQESMRVEDPCFLIGEEGENIVIRRLRNPDVMTSTIQLYLDSGIEQGELEFSFTTEIDDFHTLLGILDLYRREYYQALMEHEAVPSEFNTEDVRRSIEDGHTYGDPRWMLPFVLPVLPDATVPDQNTLNYSLYDLGKTGIFNISGDYAKLTLADPSELLCKEMVERPASIRVTNLGFTQDGKPAGMTSLYIRSKNLIWYVNIGGETGATATWASIDLDKAGELLNESFTPVGAPSTVKPAPAPQRNKSGEKKFCSICGKEATWVEQYQRYYCYSCQKYLDN